MTHYCSDCDNCKTSILKKGETCVVTFPDPEFIHRKHKRVEIPCEQARKQYAQPTEPERCRYYTVTYYYY